MSKTIIDNATFYRMLDSIGTEKEKEMFDNLFSVTLKEQIDNSIELKNIKEEILKILSDNTPYTNMNLIKLLIRCELLINGPNGLKSNNKAMEIFYTREFFIYSLITEEEKNKKIADLLKSDYFKRMELEYRCAMYELMQIEDTESEEYKKALNNMLHYKEKALRLRETPKVNYPTTDNSEVKKRLMS